MAENDDGFLTRWARRKEEARRGAELPEPAPPASDGGDADKAPAEPAVDEAELIESLPDIDSMTRESDFSVFMQKGVPRALRNRALRKLWRLDPVFANLDGLNDYDEDYTAIGKPLGQAVRTLYQVGRGMGGAVPPPEAPDASDATPSGEPPAPVPPAESAQETPRSIEQEAARGAAEAEQAAAAPADRPTEKQPANLSPGVPPGVPTGVPENAVGAERQGASPPAQSANAAPKDGGAAARRWGRFDT